MLIDHVDHSDWRSDDPDTLNLIGRVAAKVSDDDERWVTAALQSAAEFRIPVAAVDGNETAWRSRPRYVGWDIDIAREAMRHLAPLHQLAVLRSWRVCHRSPGRLAERLDVASRTVRLAAQLDRQRDRADSAVWAAVDAIEAGDGRAATEYRATAQWSAQLDSSRFARFRVAALDVGLSLLGDDPDHVRRSIDEAVDLTDGVATPPTEVVAGYMDVVEALAFGHERVIESFCLEPDNPLLDNTTLRSAAAHCHALCGSAEVGAMLARTTLDMLDPDAAYLHGIWQVAETGLLLDDLDLLDLVERLLTPWSGLVALQGNGWWIDGPIDLLLADIDVQRGGSIRTHGLLDAASEVATSTGDTRSLKRISRIRARIPVPDVEVTQRQMMVLHGVSEGRSNREIASDLGFSLSTVRAEVSLLLRVLGVERRDQAIERARALRLLPTAAD